MSRLTALRGKAPVKLPLIDRIWCVRGSLPLDPPLSPAEAFDRLDSLFDEPGTIHSVTRDTLSFTKKAPVAQDKMAIFSRGTLRVAEGRGTCELLWELTSPALLFCFAMPFFFLAIAWLLKESRNAGYVFAGIFAALYVVGRVLEPRLICSAFRKRLTGAEPSEGGVPLAG